MDEDGHRPPSRGKSNVKHQAAAAFSGCVSPCMDYGGPVGFRIVTQKPEALERLIIQNTNAYEVGFTDAWAGLRDALWKTRRPENEAGVAGLLELETVKAIYLHGSKIPELISPDNWNSDSTTHNK
jgi:hypothetical protein